MKVSNGVKVSAFGMRVLKKMSSGQILLKTATKDYSVGNIRVPSSLINEFKRIDLIKLSSKEKKINMRAHYLLSSVGVKFLKRNLSTNKKGGAEGGKASHLFGSEDRFSSQHKSMTKVMVRKKNNKGVEKILVNRCESPLGWLMGHKDKEGQSFLDPRHVLAADRLRADFDKAGLNPRVTASFDGVPLSRKHKGKSGDLLPLEHQIMARGRYQQAVDGVGPGLADVLVRVCCYLEGLAETERTLGWPNRSAKLVLRLALDRLVSHYEGPKKGKR